MQVPGVDNQEVERIRDRWSFLTFRARRPLYRFKRAQIKTPNEEFWVEERGKALNDKTQCSVCQNVIEEPQDDQN